MNIIPIETRQDFLLAQQFLIPHEVTSVSIGSLLRRQAERLYFIKNNNTVLGILNLDSTVYYCIPDTNLIDINSFSNQLLKFIDKPVRCISGEKKGNDLLSEAFSHIDMSIIDKKLTTNSYPRPKIVYSYKMMNYNKKAVIVSSENSINLSDGEEIIRCTEHDMEILHPLQKDYMKDEVAVPDRRISDAEVSIVLRQILKNQLCFALTVDGEIVAKANTNAIGINCVQIGGVYTHPLYRRNGYAGALVQSLCNRALRAHKQPVLFVKEKNLPAFSLYQKLGFEECGHYVIAYY